MAIRLGRLNASHRQLRRQRVDLHEAMDPVSPGSPFAKDTVVHCRIRSCLPCRHLDPHIVVRVGGAKWDSFFGQFLGNSNGQGIFGN